MQIARVVGNLVSSHKHERFEGAKLMLVQPMDPDGTAAASPLLAIDSVGAGVGERVLVVLEGKAAGMALGKGPNSPVDAAIVGIIDHIDLVRGAAMNDDQLRALIREASRVTSPGRPAAAAGAVRAAARSVPSPLASRRPAPSRLRTRSGPAVASLAGGVGRHDRLAPSR